MTGNALKNLIDLNPTPADFLEDVLDGLSQKQKTLLPMYFYDEVGSQLFDRICEADEYYPTRSETRLLECHLDGMLELLPAPFTLIELGSGSSMKTQLLLKQRHLISEYLPLDISRTHLLQTAEKLKQVYPDLKIIPVCADYTNLRPLQSMLADMGKTFVIFFPGSSIGNLETAEAIQLLRSLVYLMSGKGYLLVGFDTTSNPDVLIPAYNDREGYTALFNLNILRRINAELGADFELDSFRHEAIYVPERSRVEMHIMAEKRMQVEISGQKFFFEKGESIHTESSHKYKPVEFDAMALEAGFMPLQHWTDSAEQFNIGLYRAL